ncbi:hypothetical protein AQS8620_03208 [Aquimixticola soesokkakensis]|uniref:DUF3035 domain-containing protein n=1 Tax=Aquimixticola soesokkakensis TaxID=1519096 RepID=A0A1Y5TNJ9_9RHOB|nr:DUF3035 domain-containing protein [Aquimixticola soesokkakensis]SLN68240.1 hypothetical protein AQS8620_03208 [Aquimixticola soesokkakensis]
MSVGVKSTSFVLCAALLVVAGCAGDPKLDLTTRSAGPDAFAIVPFKPLEEPANYAALPVPTPGGSNRADQTPKADAIAALGGRGAPVTGNGALLAQTGRYGITPSIRAELAAADLRFRRFHDGNFISRMIARNQYEKAYRRYGINPWDESERLAALGIVTPMAPAR